MAAMLPARQGRGRSAQQAQIRDPRSALRRGVRGKTGVCAQGSGRELRQLQLRPVSSCSSWTGLTTRTHAASQLVPLIDTDWWFISVDSWFKLMPARGVEMPINLYKVTTFWKPASSQSLIPSPLIQQWNPQISFRKCSKNTRSKCQTQGSRAKPGRDPSCYLVQRAQRLYFNVTFVWFSKDIKK